MTPVFYSKLVCLILIFGIYCKQVIQHLFDWDSPRTNLGAEDVLGVLKKKFTMRVDLERRVVEYASVQEESVVATQDQGDISDIDIPDEIVTKKQKME